MGGEIVIVATSATALSNGHPTGAWYGFLPHNQPDSYYAPFVICFVYKGDEREMTSCMQGRRDCRPLVRV